MRCGRARAGLAARQRPHPARRARGSSILEFAASLPLFLILLAAFGFAVWTFWAQTAADVAAVRAVREASFNRGGDIVLPLAGFGYYNQSVATLTGGRTAARISDPQVNHHPDFRMLTFTFWGSGDTHFGPLTGTHAFAGGSAGRWWIFYAGPPDPWE